MARPTILIGTLTIANGAQNSNSLSGALLGHYASITIVSPTTLAETVNVQVGETDASGATFHILQSPPGTDVACVADRAIVLTSVPFLRLRVRATGAVAADRVFLVHGYVQPVTSP